MDKTVVRMERETSFPAHGDTILAAPIVIPEMEPPFSHSWGMLEGPGEMEAHSHDTYEMYVVTKGHGFAMIDGVRYPVKPGDIVNILPNRVHTMVNETNEAFQWAAFWWPHGCSASARQDAGK